MATRQQKEAPARKTRNYKSDTGRSVSIEPGESIEGVFQGEKTVSISDDSTGEEKDVRVFQFRDEQGKPFVFLGRTMLDQAMDVMYEAEGGLDKCIGLNVKITRGENEKLRGKRTMGTYEVSVWEE